MIRTWFEVYGCSWKGNLVKRDGEHVRCGCRHRSHHGARHCLEKMRRERPGRCQRYKVIELVVAVHKRKELDHGA